MNRFSAILVLCGVSLLSFAQDKYASTYVCTSTKVHFFSKTPLEDIEATSSSCIFVLNTQTKKISAKIPVKTFSFKDKLMQEHFNENYLETEKYPSASLDAVLTNDIDLSKDGCYKVIVKGSIEIHGVKQDREFTGTIIVTEGKPSHVEAVFDIKLVDHGIKVPTVVMASIAETIKVDLSCDLTKYEKKQ